MEVLFLIGRVLFAAVFVISALMVHFIGYRQGVEYARAYHSPAPEAGVLVTGVMALAGGLMVALGLWADLGALLLAAFLLVITPIMHAFWNESDEQARATQMAMFLKNFALLGAALVVFYLYNQLQGEAGLSITDPLFGRAD
jgi:putative oxidoreductase